MDAFLGVLLCAVVISFVAWLACCQPRYASGGMVLGPVAARPQACVGCQACLHLIALGSGEERCPQCHSYWLKDRKSLEDCRARHDRVHNFGGHQPDVAIAQPAPTTVSRWAETVSLPLETGGP